VFGSRSVASVRIGDIKRFRAHLLTTHDEHRKDDRSPKTVAKVLGVLRSILQAAIEDGAIESNPAKEVSVGTGSSFVPNRLTPEQVMAVHDYIATDKASHRHRSVCPGELLTLGFVDYKDDSRLLDQ
jgi:site-specific recombinase XerC